MIITMNHKHDNIKNLIDSFDKIGRASFDIFKEISYNELQNYFNSLSEHDKKAINILYQLFKNNHVKKNIQGK